MPSVEPRYAQALLAAAENPQMSDEIFNSLAAFEKNMEAIPEMQYFMLNPIIPASAKKEIIKKVLEEDAPVYAVNFLCLLVDKGRMGKLPGILKEFRQKKAMLSGEIIIKATSAKPLTEDEISGIAERYRQKYSASRVRVENSVDPSLLGGIRIQIGDLLRDDSLYARLKGMARAINSGI